MRYGKLINNEYNELNNAFIEYKGKVYDNPNLPNEFLVENGYKELVVLECPIFDSATQKCIINYSEDDSHIYRSFAISDYTQEELEEMNRML